MTNKKDYKTWHTNKESLNDRKDLSSIYFYEREVWWVALGLNIGFEQDGKGEEFRRPVIIIKKFNQYVFWAIPLTTKVKKNKYYIKCKIGDEVERMAIISQIRLIDSKRLISKIGILSEKEFLKIKKPIKDLL